jgi:hypothetical protein
MAAKDADVQRALDEAEAKIDRERERLDRTRDDDRDDDGGQPN